MRVYPDAIEIVHGDGDKETFNIGTQSESARQRYRKINKRLEKGFLDNLITRLRDETTDTDISLNQQYQNLIDDIIGGIDGEKGRSVTGLTVLQLTIKSICPEQSIRLHKGSQSESDFGWVEGISMRSIDTEHITPLLRNHGLLHLNSYGVMMTRSLAENYPYGRLYNANVRGVRPWAELVEAIERDPELTPQEGLKYILDRLIERQELRGAIYEDTMEAVETFLSKSPSRENIQTVVESHMQSSARLFEIAIHSMVQCCDDIGVIDGSLHPLMQMRSADKKHGNVGDIEVERDDGSIKTAWDAKMGRSSIYNSLTTLDEKLSANPRISRVAYVIDDSPTYSEQVKEEQRRLESEYDVTIDILSFNDFTSKWLDELNTQLADSKNWLTAYSETICQRRRDRAPVDEPTEEWANSLKNVVEHHMWRVK